MTGKATMLSMALGAALLGTRPSHSASIYEQRGNLQVDIFTAEVIVSIASVLSPGIDSRGPMQVIAGVRKLLQNNPALSPIDLESFTRRLNVLIFGGGEGFPGVLTPLLRKHPELKNRTIREAYADLKKLLKTAPVPRAQLVPETTPAPRRQVAAVKPRSEPL
ncbi:MAG: hypothetical protein HY078_15235 [Elusimicrobia bacterium]|nr:hypothetical protein [Elusimicrobiota bacterium]